MNIPNAKTQQSDDATETQPDIPGGGVVKRPDPLAGHQAKQLRSEVTRHSMDVDEKVAALLDETSDFQTTRSQTFTNLTAMTNNDTTEPPNKSHTLQFDHNHRSQSTVGGATVVDGRISATVKLLESSGNPVNYSNQNIHKHSSGSPIWKRRNESCAKSPVIERVRTVDGHAVGPSDACLSEQQQAKHTSTYVDTDC